MAMSDEQIIKEVVGRKADQAPPPLAFEDLGDPVVPTGREPTPPPTRGRRLITAGAVVAVAGVFVGAALVFSRPGPDGAAPVGLPAEATVEEFEAALSDALAVLEGAPGIEGVEEGYIGGHLAGKVWFSTRAGGDTVVVAQTDIDVQDTAWWLTSANPPAVGEHIFTTARMVVNGNHYEATVSDRGSEPWSLRDSGVPPRSLAFGLVLFDAESGAQFREMLTPPGAEVIRQATYNGGVIWTVTAPSDDANAVHRSHVHPDGHLVSWSLQTPGLPRNPADESSPIDAGRVSFTPLGDPDPIEVPEVGAPLDLSVFDLPDDFLIGK